MRALEAILHRGRRLLREEVAEVEHVRAEALRVRVRPTAHDEPRLDLEQLGEDHLVPAREGGVAWRGAGLGRGLGSGSGLGLRGESQGEG